VHAWAEAEPLRLLPKERGGGKEALAHAVKISSGGPPIFLVAEEETFTFPKP